MFHIFSYICTYYFRSILIHWGGNVIWYSYYGGQVGTCIQAQKSWYLNLSKDCTKILLQDFYHTIVCRMWKFPNISQTWQQKWSVFHPFSEIIFNYYIKNGRWKVNEQRKTVEFSALTPLIDTLIHKSLSFHW